MRRIGYWIESLRDEQFCPPQELVGQMPAELRLLVANYLDQGQTVAVARGKSWCRFFCERKMGSREFTDGHWIWPEDLGHYVRDHGVVLPSEFVDQVQSGNPSLAESEWDTSSIDLSFWKKWCQEHRSGKLIEKIAEARRRADIKAQAVLAAQVAKREKEEGLSSEMCQWQGCTHRALRGRVLCAACCMKGETKMWTMQCYADLRPVLVAG